MKHYFVCYFNLTMIFFLIKTQINRILFFSQSNSIHFHHTDTQISHKFQGTGMQNSNQTQRTGMQNPLQIQTTSIQNSHKIQGTGMQSMPPSRPHTKKDTDDKKIIVCVNKLLLACPEKGSARGKNGLRNFECFPPRNAFPLASSLPNQPIIHLFILPSRITP